MYNYYFQIAELLICIRTPFVVYEFYELNSYRITNRDTRQIDIEYTLQFIDDGWDIQGNKIQESRKSCIFETKDAYYRYFFWNVHTDKKFIVLEQKKNNYHHFVIYIQKESIDKLVKELHFPPLMSMEQVLLEYNAFQLHSSVIEWNEKGILFSAPSGVGKSTQANLWKQYENATIVNGDKAIIRKKDKKFFAYGSPYAGTSSIYTNISVPICGIVILAQAKENRIEKLSNIDALKKIYSESTVCVWNQRFVEQFIDLLGELIYNIPIYYFSCRPDKEAVNLLKETLLKENRK